MKGNFLLFLALALGTSPAGVALANEQTVVIWQLESQQDSPQKQSQLQDEIQAPAHSSQRIALHLETANILQLNPKNTIAVVVPSFQELLQLDVTRVKKHEKQTIIHASDAKQRMVITTDGINTFATVMTEHGVWSIRGKGSDALMYQTHSPTHTDDKAEEDYRIAPSQQLIKKKSTTQQQSGDVNSDTIAVVDAYFLYNEASAQLYGSDAGALTRINHIVAVTNDIYQASNVKIELNALRIDKVVYPQNYNSSTALYHATGLGNNSTFFGRERQIRDAIGADAMILLRPYVGDGYCGIAWVNSSFVSNAYMVSHTSIDCGDEVNAHELGHNMGLAHSRRQGNVGATYPFALGHGVDSSFTTVMAYPQAFNGANRVFKFSSPDLVCNNQPCGVDRNDEINGADSVYALNQKRFEISAVAQRGLSFGSLNVQVSGVDNAIISSSSGQGGTAPYSLEELELGSQVILTAPASASGIPFYAWAGCDSVTDFQCNVSITGDRRVTAVFATAPESFGEAVEAPQLDFVSVNTSPWQIDLSTSAVGPASIRSAIIDHAQQSIVETTVEGAGTLSFNWKVSSEQNFDFLTVYIDGILNTRISGEMNWQEVSVSLPQGTHQIRWIYSKDGTVSNGADAAWVDNVRWETTAAERQLTLNKSGSGKGTVTTGPTVTVCDEQCSGFVSSVDIYSEIYLSASPDAQSVFSGWTGACSGQSEYCHLYVTEDIVTTALFTQAVQPANDNFGAATVISGLTGQVRANNLFATSQSSDPQITGKSGKTVWWKWTAPAAGFTSLNTFNSNFNTVLAVYRGSSPSNLTQVALNDDALFSQNSELSFFAQAGVSYYFLVDGIGGASGEIELNWELQAEVLLTVNRAGEGSGMIQLPPFAACGGSSCSYQTYTGQAVTFIAVPDAHSVFSGWAGKCSGTGTCQFTLTENSSVTATFALKTYELNTSVTEGGVIDNGPVSVTHGQPAVFKLSPARGYRVNREVSGTCPAGQWLDAVTYQTGAATSPCSINFSFIKINRRKFPYWLLYIQND